ncbi:MAG TPA: ABC transporter substrate-binding protein [Candidatus Lustribacter sp.]
MNRAFRIAGAALLVAPLLFISPGTRAAAQTGDQIVIATPPNDSSGEVFYAADMGFFKKAGLNVKLVPMNNAGGVTPAVLSGTVTIGGLSVPSIAIAREKGVPITIVAPGSVYSSAAPTSGIIVLKNSPLHTAADLNGKTLATRDLSNLSYYGANTWIDKNGGDSKSIKWIELSDTADVAAMQQGRIDAASVSEPALDDAIHGAGRMLAPVYDAIGDKFLIAGFFTTADYANAHPVAMRKFAAAIIAAGKWANQNHARSAKILEKYAGIPIPLNYTRVTYAERLRAEDAQPVLDMLKSYGALKSSVSAADLFSPIVYGR